MILTKRINNIVSKNIISSNIVEYDIKAAGPTAIYFINNRDKDVYEKLLSMDKIERNVKIGLMQKYDKSLREKIDKLTLSWFNEFLTANNISENNFLGSTPDSLFILNKICPHTVFQDGKVVFRNKEKIYYTSMFIVNNKVILFDRMSKRIRIRGLGVEEKTNMYPFVKFVLRELCCILEDQNTLGRNNCLNKLKIFRNSFLKSKNIEIFRNIDDDNKFRYIVNGECISSDIPLQESGKCVLVKSDNYMNYILPLIQSYI